MTGYEFSDGKIIYVLGHSHFTPGKKFYYLQDYLMTPDAFIDLENVKTIIASYDSKYAQNLKNTTLVSKLLNEGKVQVLAVEGPYKAIDDKFKMYFPQMKETYMKLKGKSRDLYAQVFLLIYGPEIYQYLIGSKEKLSSVRFEGVDSQELRDKSNKSFDLMVNSFESLAEGASEVEEKNIASLEHCITKSLESNMPVADDTLKVFSQLFTDDKWDTVSKVINSRNQTIQADKDRDIFMAKKLLKGVGNTFYAVGSAHVNGIHEYYQQLKCK